MTWSGRIEFCVNLLRVLWGAGLVVGGIIFTVYFFYIGFMPEMDLSGSVTLVIVAAFTGVILLGWLSFVLAFPGWVWQSAKSLERSLNSRWWLALPTLGLIFGFFMMPWESQSVHFWEYPSTTRWWFAIVVWFLSLILPPILLFWESKRHCLIAKLRQLEQKLGPRFSRVRPAQQPTADFEGTEHAPQQNVWQKIWATLVFYVGLGYSSFCFSLAFLFVHALVQRSPNLGKHPMLAELVSIFVIWFGNLAPVAEGKSMLRTLAVGVWIMFMVVGFSSGWLFLPRAVMRAYEFGGFRASLLLDETGCSIVHQHGFKPPADSKACSVPDVMIHVRLGNLYYVELPPVGATPCADGGKGSSPCFTIPAQHVLSWAPSNSATGKSAH